MSSSYSLIVLMQKKKIILPFLFCGKKKQHLNYSPLITSLPNLFLSVVDLIKTNFCVNHLYCLAFAALDVTVLY